ncbi:TPA: BspA family leucine-rich repeat surface protein [Enterococcus faecium]
MNYKKSIVVCPLLFLFFICLFSKHIFADVDNSSININNFILSDWKYEVNDKNEVLLFQYNGNSDDLTIPGEINLNGELKHVVLVNFNSTVFNDPESIEIKEVDNKKVGLQTTDLSGAFYNSNIKTIRLSGLDTSNVINMKQMFFNSTLENADFLGIDTSNVVTMEEMFTFTNLIELKQDFNTKNVTNMKNMFAGLKSNINFIDVNNFDVSNVTDVSRMFAANPNILYYDLSKWSFKKENVKLYQMFTTYGSNGSIPLLVLTTDPILLKQNEGPNEDQLNYEMPSYNRSLPGPYFYGGTVKLENDVTLYGEYNNNNNYIYYFKEFFIRPNDPKLNIESIKKFISQEEQEIPKLSSNNNYKFVGYKLDDRGTNLNNIKKLTDSFYNFYSAQWSENKDNININDQNSNSSKISFIHVPSVLSTGSINLLPNGKQEIPFLKQEDFNIEVQDLDTLCNDWSVNAKFEWIGNNRIPNAYIHIISSLENMYYRTKNIENSNNQYIKVADNSVLGLTDIQLKDGETVKIMYTNSGKIINGIFHYKAEDINLVIPDTSVVTTGEYNGEIHWYLNRVPN